MQKLKLILTHSKFESLHKTADGKAKNHAISKADLTALLMDHSRMAGMLKDCGVQIESS